MTTTIDIFTQSVQITGEEWDFLLEHYPGFRFCYRTTTGYLVFEHEADLYMLLTPGKQVMVSQGWKLVDGGR